MPSSVSIGEQLEATVSRLVSAGRYHSKSEIIREGIRLVEEREQHLSLLNAALARGIADASAGRVHSAEDIFAQMRARYQGMLDRQPE